MRIWAVVLTIFCAPAIAAEVRVLEPAIRAYAGPLGFIKSGARLESKCIRIGTIVFRNAPFSAKTIQKMQDRAAQMGADTLLIKDTTIGRVDYDYVIRMGAYRCADLR